MNTFIAKLKAFFTSAELALKSDVEKLEARINLESARIKVLEAQLKAKLTKGGATSTKKGAK